jgi:hypothetical protein
MKMAALSAMYGVHAPGYHVPRPHSPADMCLAAPLSIPKSAAKPAEYPALLPLALNSTIEKHYSLPIALRYAIRYIQTMASLAQIHAWLDDVDEKIAETVNTGAQYSLTGSHAATQHTLDALNKQRSRLMRRINRMQGSSSRVSPQYDT